VPWLCVLGVSSILAFAAELGLARTLSNAPAEAYSSAPRADAYRVPQALINAGVDCDYMCLAQITAGNTNTPALSAAELFAVADRR